LVFLFELEYYEAGEENDGQPGFSWASSV